MLPNASLQPAERRTSKEILHFPQIKRLNFNTVLTAVPRGPPKGISKTPFVVEGDKSRVPNGTLNRVASLPLTETAHCPMQMEPG